MRTLKLTLMVALALALGATTASASSVDVIWQVSNSGTTTVTASSTITGNIVISVGGSDTAVAGTGAVLELSADAVGASILGATQTVLANWIGLGVPTIGPAHSENVIAQGDLFGFGVGVQPGTSAVIGTITVHATTGGSVVVSATGPADDIIGAGGASLLGQFSFGGGNIVVPEPTTASLLGLGLIGLTVAGRQRKR